MILDVTDIFFLGIMCDSFFLIFGDGFFVKILLHMLLPRTAASAGMHLDRKTKIIASQIR